MTPLVHRPGRIIAVVPILVAVLAGCAGVTGDSEGAALRALAGAENGDATAERQALFDAQRQDPTDPRTLLAAATYYDRTGRPVLARQYYEAVLAHRRAVAMPEDGDRRSSPEAVAMKALARLDGTAIADRAAVAAIPIPAEARPSAERPAPPPTAAIDWDDDPVVRRFLIFSRLWQLGVVTANEFAERRYPNLGVLLPYAEAPPSIDVFADPPDADELAAALRATRPGKARTRLLDGLLPAKIATRTLPLKRSPAALADAEVRVRALKAAGLVTAAEAEREIQAIARLHMVATP